MPIVTLLTDFGTADYYVAAVKGTLLRLAPGTTLVDLSHDVAPGDVEGAAFLLAAAAPAFPPATIHLAVVDPGVGSARRLLAVGSRTALFVAPDNGLLSAFVEEGEVRAVERTDLYLPAPGSTFHGRDRLAPVAAYLARGKPLAELGPIVADPLQLASEPPRRAPSGALSGRVIHIDRFGNLITDIPSDWLPPGACEARLCGRQVRRRVTHYRELGSGEAGLLPGSLGTVEISLNGDSLARRWSVTRGARVSVTSWRSGSARGAKRL